MISTPSPLEQLAAFAIVFALGVLASLAFMPADRSSRPDAPRLA